MTNREQAIKRVAEAFKADPRAVEFALEYDRGIAYAVDTTEKLLAAEARVLELEAERAEQLSILTSVGPITCRNGKQHEHYDGCVYCRIEELEDALEELIFASECLVSHAYINDARAALQPKGE